MTPETDMKVKSKKKKMSPTRAFFDRIHRDVEDIRKNHPEEYDKMFKKALDNFLRNKKKKEGK